jgi:uncharacterized membrane protein YfcA
MAGLPVLIAGGIAAGAFGALLGLGGGILMVPFLSLGFGLPLRDAVGVSLVCVVVTSSASASVYLQRDLTNLRLGMTLELFTAMAALAGGLIAFMLPDRALALMFAALLLYVAVTMLRGARESAPLPVEGAPVPIEAAPSPAPKAEADPVAPEAPRGYLASLSGPGYRVRNLGRGIGGSLLAGLVSALFGVGGGIVKVPVMNLVMGVPLRVAAATSNLMIGVTASVGAIVYFLRGGIDPYVAAPTAVGVFAGASLASRLAHRVDMRILRWLFVIVLVFIAAQMAYRGLR